jgi:hypothetical protein
MSAIGTTQILKCHRIISDFRGKAASHKQPKLFQHWAAFSFFDANFPDETQQDNLGPMELAQ